MDMKRCKTMVLALVVALAACGGGGDVAGDYDGFTTNVEEWVVRGQSGCPGAGHEVWVTIIGGQPPFRIHNPRPSIVQVDRTEVSGKDPVFKITTVGTACAEFAVTVHDYHSRMAAVNIQLEDGSKAPEAGSSS
jgi:hypothetical protein